jgi:hypothetical protein
MWHKNWGQVNGIYYFSGSTLNINDSNKGVFDSYNTVVVSSGTVNINVAGSTFAPGKSLALLASRINFATNLTEADRIFSPTRSRLKQPNSV